MKLCNETITVFNAKLNPDTGCDDYIATVIDGVSWFCETASTADNLGLKTANRFTVRIPETAKFSGKTYADPRAYAAAAEVSGLFTLQHGDVVVRGRADTSLRPAALHKQYEALTILGVTDNRRARNAPHWKVVGA